MEFNRYVHPRAYVKGEEENKLWITKEEMKKWFKELWGKQK